MKDCIFCKIVKKEIPAKIVYEDRKIIAFDDVAPKAPVHVVIIPKKHIPTIAQATPKDKELIGELFLAAVKIAKKKGLTKSGYRLIFNVGRDAGQTIDHLHLHLLGGKKLPFA
ncbi:MAG: histidine triad nucleotide-binding protein [Candidatus Pacebacteria bacterium]|nr:histidine triad nucleotide-binding protein [Candidatus Paceibacterota bacterium]